MKKRHAEVIALAINPKKAISEKQKQKFNEEKHLSKLRRNVVKRRKGKERKDIEKEITYSLFLIKQEGRRKMKQTCGLHEREFFQPPLLFHEDFQYRYIRSDTSSVKKQPVKNNFNVVELVERPEGGYTKKRAIEVDTDTEKGLAVTTYWYPFAS